MVSLSISSDDEIVESLTNNYKHTGSWKCPINVKVNNKPDLLLYMENKSLDKGGKSI